MLKSAIASSRKAVCVRRLIIADDEGWGYRGIPLSGAIKYPG